MVFQPSSRAKPDEQAPDVALMMRVCQGDEESFAQLYAGYHRAVLDFFYGLARDPFEAGELCQETFLRIWRVRRKYRATGAFPAYLFAFARNIWLERCRERRKQYRLGFASSLDDHVGGLADNPSAHPDAAASRSELRDRLFEALDELPEAQRMVFMLRNVEGLSLEEIAAIMQCPVNTVRSRRILAVGKLRKALERVFASWSAA